MQKTVIPMVMGLAFSAPELAQTQVSSVQDMRGMFSGAQAFDQDLSEWDVSSAGNLREMFTGSLSTANYDALLNGWSRLTLQNGVWLDTGSTRYTAASAAARKSIEDRFGWTFNDGGLGLSVAGTSGPRLMASPSRRTTCWAVAWPPC